jgi:hypothetical protein
MKVKRYRPKKKSELRVGYSDNDLSSSSRPDEISVYSSFDQDMISTQGKPPDNL